MTLEQLGIPCEMRVVSAHRTPDHLFRYAETAADRGIRVIIAGAGGAAHLPGMLAAKTTLPVIGVPVPTQHLGGLDSLLSIVQMPRGIPVATVAIGNAENAALLAAPDPRPVGPGARGARRRAATGADRRGPGRPVERGAAARLTGVATAAIGGRGRPTPGPRRLGPMDDERWEPGMPVLDRQPVHAPAGASSLPPSLQGLPPRSVPETAPTPLQKHYVLLSRPGADRRARSRSPRSSSGAGLGSPLVKLCVLIAAPLLLVDDRSTRRCGSGARRGRGCRSIAARACSGSPGSSSASCSSR